MDNLADRHWQRACRYYADSNLLAAKASCEAMLVREPDHPLAHWLLATVFLEQGRERGATRHAEQASHHAAQLPIEDRLRITWSLINTGQSDAAQKLLLNIDPTQAAAQRSLRECAQQLALLDLHKQALACLDALSGPAATDPAVNHLRGTLFGFLGRREQAAVAFENAIAAAPNFSLAHWSLSQLGLIEGSGERIDRLRRLQHRVTGAGDALVHVGYALFRELDAIDDCAGAWQALASGAKTRDATVQYDDAAETRLFDQLLAVETPAGALATRAGDDIPLFIVGMPRTGTTLLERILGNHTDVAICGELTDFSQQLYWAMDRSYPGMLDSQSVAMLPDVDAADLGARYLNATAWRRNGLHFFSDKNPGNFLLSGLIASALPQAKILHIRRNPMDACFSNFKMLFAPGVYDYSYNLRNLASHHHNYARLMRHFQTKLPGQMLTVDYEDLVAEPEAQASRIVQFCRLPAQSKLSDLSTNARAVTTASRGQVREPVHTRNIGSWKRYREPLEPLRQLLEAD